MYTYVQTSKDMLESISIFIHTYVYIPVRMCSKPSPFSRVTVTVSPDNVSTAFRCNIISDPPAIFHEFMRHDFDNHGL